jgi:hypothetical protein
MFHKMKNDDLLVNNNTITTTIRHPVIFFNNFHQRFVNHILKMDEKTRRLLIFALFFVLLISILYVLSRIYKFINELKFRNKKYGYVINPRCESIVIKLNDQVRYQKLALISNLNHKIDTFKQQKYEKDKEKKLDNLRFSQKDSGNLNTVFQIDDEQFSDIELLKSSGISSLNEDCISEVSEESFKTNACFMKEYFETQRQNRLVYKKFGSKSKQNETSGCLSMKKRPLKTGRFSNSRKPPLESIQESSKEEPRKQSKKKVFENDSVCTNLTVITTELPTILVTDTSSMNTIIIDLDWFEE